MTLFLTIFVKVQMEIRMMILFTYFISRSLPTTVTCSIVPQLKIKESKFKNLLAPFHSALVCHFVIVQSLVQQDIYLTLSLLFLLTKQGEVDALNKLYSVLV